MEYGTNRRSRKMFSSNEGTPEPDDSNKKNSLYAQKIGNGLELYLVSLSHYRRLVCLEGSHSKNRGFFLHPLCLSTVNFHVIRYTKVDSGVGKMVFVRSCLNYTNHDIHLFLLGRSGVVCIL